MNTLFVFAIFYDSDIDRFNVPLTNERQRQRLLFAIFLICYYFWLKQFAFYFCNKL